MATRREEFEELAQKLIPLGEDEKDLRFWGKIFDDLSETEKEDVLKNLRTEFEILEKQKKKAEGGS